MIEISQNTGKITGRLIVYREEMKNHELIINVITSHYAYVTHFPMFVIGIVRKYEKKMDHKLKKE